MRIISCQSTLVAVVAVALIVVYYTEAKTTPKPKYQYTKKPVPQITVHSPVTTSVPKTLKIVPTANPVKPHPPPNPVRTTNPSHVFPQHYPDGTGPPGVGPENYTLDYNECYFNFCECCPPERGPRGLKGERGLTGIDSLICFNVINYCLVCLASDFPLTLILLRGTWRKRPYRSSWFTWATWHQWSYWLKGRKRYTLKNYLLK